MEQLGPGTPRVGVRTFRDIVEPELRVWRTAALVFATFGALALALAAAGVFSVVAYRVAERRLEMGIRAALGARPADLLRLVIVGAIYETILGLGIGLALVFLAYRSLTPGLLGISPTAPATMLGVGVTFLSAAILASALPAARAARTDPSATLRSLGR